MSDYLKALALSSALSLASAPTQAAPPQGIRLVDARHKAIALPRPARRIVSLQPSFTEAICALGGCHALVGVDRYLSWPVLATTLPQVGSIRDPDIEHIIAHKPDVVLARPPHRRGGAAHRAMFTAHAPAGGWHGCIQKIAASAGGTSAGG